MNNIEKEILVILAAAKINGWIAGKKNTFEKTGISCNDGRKIVLEAIKTASERMLAEK